MSEISSQDVLFLAKTVGLFVGVLFVAAGGEDIYRWYKKRQEKKRLNRPWVSR